MRGNVPLHKIAARLRSELDLPAGYMVEIDHYTRNIIVKNDKLGFVISNTYLRDHTIDFTLFELGEQLAALKAATVQGPGPHGGIYSVKRLAEDRCWDWNFDRI